MSAPFPVILLVEDNSDHAELIIRSLNSHEIDCSIQHVYDGGQALDYLFQRGDFTNPEKYPRPSLVIMDLRMPKIDGFEVLNQIKKEKELKTIPIVILTTSKADRDITSAFDHYANSYLVKPVDFELFRSQIHDVCTYWLKWNRQPESTPG